MLRIVAGDIIGSNITNIALILGLTRVIRPLIIKHTEIYSGKIHLLILTLASVFIIASGGIAFIFWGLRPSGKGLRILETPCFKKAWGFSVNQPLAIYIIIIM